MLLIVDDSKSIRERIGSIVSSVGYTYVEADDGVRALEILHHREDIEMVITDCNMIDMNGDELVLNIRDLDQYAFVPIIMVTTEVENGKYMGLPISAWIRKPFKEQDLINAIQLTIS